MNPGLPNTPIDTTIYFIRHGEVDNPGRIVYGRLPLPLTPGGSSQIKNLAQRLKDKGITPVVIYSSPLKRTMQSAEEINRVYPGILIVKENGLMESDVSSIQGKTFEWVKQRGGDEYNIPGYPVEEPEAVVERMRDVVEEVVHLHKGETVFIVGHADPLAWIVWRLMHPVGNLPSVEEMIQAGAYLDKGEAWKVVLYTDFKVVEKEMIRREKEF